MFNGPLAHIILVGRDNIYVTFIDPLNLSRYNQDQWGKKIKPMWTNMVALFSIVLSI